MREDGEDEETRAEADEGGDVGEDIQWEGVKEVSGGVALHRTSEARSYAKQTLTYRLTLVMGVVAQQPQKRCTRFL